MLLLLLLLLHPVKYNYKYPMLQSTHRPSIDRPAPHRYPAQRRLVGRATTGGCHSPPAHPQWSPEEGRRAGGVTSGWGDERGAGKRPGGVDGERSDPSTPQEHPLSLVTSGVHGSLRSPLAPPMVAPLHPSTHRNTTPRGPRGYSYGVSGSLRSPLTPPTRHPTHSSPHPHRNIPRPSRWVLTNR